ncbi:unnamed protein product [Taenia asiatica]|uniref:DUF5727 domain-containing protein n=1 Tax=Taenia asiatica TaxID=60517 RepID=A0A0R3VV21_TAEAS|nr:unnamed protein product [Taenia asiatica]
MHYECDSNFSVTIVRGSLDGQMTVRNDTCYYDEVRKWGKPCIFRENKAEITLDDVLAQNLMALVNARPGLGLASTTFFAPRCEFPKPAPGSLIKDVGRDLRIFRGVFPGKTDGIRDRFTIAGGGTSLVVSVDYRQRAATGPACIAGGRPRMTVENTITSRALGAF